MRRQPGEIDDSRLRMVTICHQSGCQRQFPPPILAPQAQNRSIRITSDFESSCRKGGKTEQLDALIAGPEYPPFPKANPILQRVNLDLSDRKRCHVHVIEPGRPFRPSQNAAAYQRPLNSYRPDGTGFPDRQRSHRSSTWQGCHRPASRSDRTPLERALAQRNVCLIQTRSHRRERVITPLRHVRIRFQHALYPKRTSSKRLRSRERGMLLFDLLPTRFQENK